MNKPYLSWPLAEVETAEDTLSDARAILRSMGLFRLAVEVDRAKLELGRRAGQLYIAQHKPVAATLPLFTAGAYGQWVSPPDSAA